MIRVLVTDDHAIVRQGLKQIIGEARGMEVTGEAANGAEAIERVRSEAFDVVLLDLSMPGRGGLDALKQIRLEYPRLPIVILTMHAEEQYAIRAIKAGANAYMSKDGPPDQLVEAIRKVFVGGRYVTPELAEQLASHLTAATAPTPHEALSDREFEVFRAIAAGKGVQQIADEQALSVKTVSTYKTRMLKKLGLRTTADVVLYAARTGIVE